MATPLRRILSISTIAIVLVQSAAGQLSRSEIWDSITVAEPLKITLHDRMELRKWCRTFKPIHGCTIFASEQLSCSCVRHGNGWRLAAKARFAPVMFLYVGGPDVTKHEQSHIDDIRTMLAEYLQQLTGREFQTEEKCLKQAKGSSNAEAFVRQMNAFRQRSNKERR